MDEELTINRRTVPLALLSIRDFRLVWFVGAVSGTVRWLDMLAVSVYVLVTTGSPLLVALMFFLRMVPLFLFGAVTGALAENMDRKKTLVIGLCILAVIYLILGGLAWIDRLETWHLGFGVFCGGLLWSLDLSIRRTMVAEIAGMERIGAAMGLDASTNSFTRMLGPFIGGLVFELTGLYGALFLGASLYALAAFLLSLVDYESRSKVSGYPRFFNTFKEGIRFVFTSRIIAGTLAVTIALNLFGFSLISMVPVIAKEELGLSPFPTGILVSAEGAGAFLGCLLLAFFAHPQRFAQIYVGGAGMYLCCIAIFALSSHFVLSYIILWIAGFGIAGFATMQSALIISNSPPEMRTRVMGVLSMCIGFAPIGTIFVGLLANQLGAVTGVLILASSGILAMAGTIYLWPELTRERLG